MHYVLEDANAVEDGAGPSGGMLSLVWVRGIRGIQRMPASLFSLCWRRRMAQASALRRAAFGQAGARLAAHVRTQEHHNNSNNDELL